MLTIDILKDQIYRALMKPENRLEDGKPNWNFVEADLYIDNEEKCYGFDDMVDTAMGQVYYEIFKKDLDTDTV